MTISGVKPHDKERLQWCSKWEGSMDRVQMCNSHNKEHNKEHNNCIFCSMHVKCNRGQCGSDMMYLACL